MLYKSIANYTYNRTVGGVKYLTQVTTADNAKSHYTYDSGNRLIRVYDAESKYGVEYSYDAQDNVTSIREFSDASGTKQYGAGMSAERVSAYETKYTDFGNDHTLETAEDNIVTHCMFDAYGRTTCCYSTNYDGTEVYGAETAAYTNNSTTSKKNNRTTSAATVGIQGYNLLSNSGLETAGSAADSAQGWDAIKTYGSTNAVVKSDGPVRTGEKAIKLWISENATDLREVGYYQTVTLTAGITYTFSAHADTSDIKKYNTGDSGLYIAFTNTSGSVLASSHKINYSTELIGDGWERLHVTYTPPTSGEYRVAVYQKGATYIGGFDDLQLEVGGAPTSCNLLQNSRFTNDTDDWSAEKSARVPDNTSDFGTQVMQIYANSSEQHRSAQTVKTNVSSASTFVVSGWGRAIAAPNNVTEIKNSTDRYFGLIVTLNYATVGTEVHLVPFNTIYTGWQYTSGMIVPKKDDTITSIKVECAYDNNLNTAYFDNISLTVEPIQTYSYNVNGMLVASTATGTAEQSYTYSGANLTKMVAGGNGTYTYTYNAANQVRTATNDGVTLTVGYSAMGNTTGTNWGPGSSGSTNLKSFAGYDGTGNYVASTSDGNGVYTTYEYGNDDMTSSKTGTLNKTFYGYHASNDRPYQTYQSGVIALFYGYKNGMLSNLSRKLYRSGTAFWQSYQFAYDEFGNTTGIYVSGDDNTTGGTIDADSRLLAGYQYGDHNGYLTRMTYGNGDYVEYAYDQFGRLIAEEYYAADETLEVRYVYLYAANGDLAKQYVTNAEGEQLSADTFEYDSLGRLIRSRSQVGSTTTQRTEHIYDKDNRITKQSWQMGSMTYTQAYTYRSADGALTKVVTSENGTTKDTLNYSYDSIKRLSTRSNSVYTQTYGYKQIAADSGYGVRSSTLVSEYKYTGKLTQTYQYTYDSNGNITKVTQGSNVNAYTYDGQGQLTKETITTSSGSTTYNYTYDTAGNILSVKSGSTTVNYTYGNGAWRDLLTAYNGSSITYDDAGNPTTYYDGNTMTWTQGRRLAEIKNGNTTVASYTYDMSGIRTSKTVGSTTYHYITQNGQVVRQTWGNKSLDIVYDNNNQPYYCVYNNGTTSTTYYYITNLQGDVVRLARTDGTIAASYTYNAWGKLIASSGSMASVNPIRYRGYYYDTETGFYYLQSRYYDPVTCRFINADGYVSTGQGFLCYNMYAYCGNNPASNNDIQGNMYERVGGLGGAPNMGGATGGFGGAHVNGTVAAFAVGVALTTAGALEEKFRYNQYTASNDAKTTQISLATTGTTSDSAIYYGADIKGGNWKIVTGPMTSIEAKAWVGYSAVSGAYGKKTSWGIYTQDRTDAFQIAWDLGLGAMPIPHVYRINQYPHFHVGGYVFLDKYKHFHLWYGTIYGGQ